MLDLNLNFVPEKVKNIHLISACGTGMGALSAMLKDLGYNITGSDHGIYPPMSTFLEKKGVKLFDGFSSENIGDDVDLVIIGNAVSKENTEAVEVHKRKLNYVSMPQAINHFFAKDKKVVLVTGTHGKTTTTGLISWILENSGKNPSFFIGGIHKNFDSGYKNSTGEYIVVEGDEYDTAFFDKESKFLHFNPAYLVMTGIEFDHGDIFDSIDDIKGSFEKLLLNLSETSSVYGFDSSIELKSVLENLKNGNLNFYGEESKSKVRYKNVSFKENGADFTYVNGSLEKEIFLPMSGYHNIYNCLAAVSVCLDIGLSFDEIQNGLKTYKGMKRRQELKGEVSGVKIIDDFAHHPTEVKFTIQGIKNNYNPKRLIAVFEPRTNTSMRNIFQKDYEFSFDEADIVLIRQPSRLDKVPENERLSSKSLVDGLKEKGILAYFHENTEDIIEHIIRIKSKGDLVLIMSNGGFDNIHERLLASL